MTFLQSLIVSGVVAAEGASGAPPPPTPPSFRDEVVVTATRSDQGVERLPVEVEVLLPADLVATGVQFLDDALRQIPGFALLREQSSRAAHPTAQSVAFRGMGGSSASRALVLVDGAPINDPFGGWVLWGRVPLASIERVEVVRAGSVVWGNLGIGGTIQVVTRPPGSNRFSLGASGGDHGTVAADLEASGRSEPWGWTASGHHFSSGGYLRIPSEARGAVDRKSDLDQRSVDVAAEWSAAAGLELRLRLGGFEEDRGSGVAGEHNASRVRWLQLSGERPAGEGSWRFHLHGSRVDFENLTMSVSTDRNSTTPAQNQFDAPSSGVGGDVQWSSRRGGHDLLAGMDLLQTAGESNDELRFSGSGFTRRRLTGGAQRLVGGYLQDLYDLAENWTLSAAVRFDAWRTFDGRRRETDLATGAKLTHLDFPAQSGSELSPSAGLTFRVSDASLLRWAVFRGFRAPTANELFKPTRSRGDVILESNSALEPESLSGTELGWDWVSGVAWRATASLFWQELEQSIQNVTIAEAGPIARSIAPCGFVAAGGICRQRQNLGSLRSRGIEVGVTRRWSSGARVNLDLQLIDAEITSAPRQPQLVGRRPRQAPERQASAGLTVPFGGEGSVSAFVRWVGKRYEDDLNTQRVGELVTVNLAASRPVTRALTLTLAVENLLDRENQAGWSGSTPDLGAPRLVSIGLRWQPGAR